MTEEMTATERVVAAAVGRRYCTFTGRGTSAIYVALRALDATGAQVVIPTLCCPSPANAARRAGWEPVFADVTVDDFTIDVSSLERVLDAERDVRAVLPVHLYGHIADMTAVSEIAASRGIAVIEDAAQALGGTVAGGPAGSAGDASILSFGHTKLLDVGVGGAVVTDDPVLHQRMRAEAARLPPVPSDLAARGEEYRRVYYALQAVAGDDVGLQRLFQPLPDIFADLYAFGPVVGFEAALEAALPAVDRLVAARRRRAELYAALAAHPAVHAPTPRAGSVPWRYTFRLVGIDRRAFSERLRQRGVDVSNWYPPLHRWYESGWRQVADGMSFSQGEAVGREVVNLWVDPEMDEPTIERNAEMALEVLNELTDAGRGTATSEVAP